MRLHLHFPRMLMQTVGLLLNLRFSSPMPLEFTPESQYVAASANGGNMTFSLRQRAMSSRIRPLSLFRRWGRGLCQLATGFWGVAPAAEPSWPRLEVIGDTVALVREDGSLAADTRDGIYELDNYREFMLLQLGRTRPKSRTLH